MFILNKNAMVRFPRQIVNVLLLSRKHKMTKIVTSDQILLYSMCSFNMQTQTTLLQSVYMFWMRLFKGIVCMEFLVYFTISNGKTRYFSLIETLLKFSHDFSIFHKIGPLQLIKLRSNIFRFNKVYL